MNLAPDGSLLIVMVIFIINYFVVRRFLVEPVTRVITERETDIRSADTLYEQALTKFNDATASIEERLLAARKEGASVRDRLRNEAASHRVEVIEKTRAEAERLVAEADAALRGDVSTAREAILRESEDLARLAAERVLGRRIA
jgi:F-type H+-transporting ATPase subunit b